MPTLGEFIETAKTFGGKLRRTPELAEGSRGPVHFYYLQRRDFGPFVVLPDLRQDRRLERATVENWCEILGLPREDFGLPPAAVEETDARYDQARKLEPGAGLQPRDLLITNPGPERTQQDQENPTEQTGEACA